MRAQVRPAPGLQSVKPRCSLVMEPWSRHLEGRVGAGRNEQHHALLIEAKGVQRYIFAAGPLRDLIGASDLVHTIATLDGDDLVGEVLAALGLTPGTDIVISRRASGAVSLHGPRETLARVRNQLRLAIMTTRPGLKLADSFGTGESPMAALDDAYRNGSGLRVNLAAGVLPLGRPPMLVAPETGMPATGQATYRGRGGAEGDTRLLDHITGPHRRRGDALQTALERGSMDGVAARFDGRPRDNRRLVYPRNFDEDDTLANPRFPWRNGSDRRIAIVHIDLSGLGEAYQQKGGRSPDGNMELARAIEAAILGAVQAANHEVLQPAAYERTIGTFVQAIVPARPLVIGGDDITVLVRADLALAFTMRALVEIETRTAADAEVGPLSAGAGIAIAGASMPFLHLNALAESLCTHAKKIAKAVPRAGGEAWPSALAFHVQTATEAEDYGQILKTLGDPTMLLRTANPYGVGARDLGRPSVDALLALAAAIAGLPGASGALRGIEAVLAEGGTARADELWRNWRRAAARRDPAGLAKVDQALKATGVDAIDEGRVSIARADRTTALFDALRLVDLGAAEARGAPAPVEPMPAEKAA